MRRALLLVVAMAGSAYAQAPGMVPPQAPPPASGVMDRRWAIAFALGLESVTPHHDTAQNASLGVLQLSGRVRVRPDIELALTLGAGGGENDTLTTGGLYFDFRYRFMAEQPWNVLALAGFGVATVAGKNAPDADHKGRGSLRIGAGIERRFDTWALEADLKLFGIGENSSVAPVYPETQPYQVARYGLSGAVFDIGASFYF
jgi:hypothetical protein